MHNGQQSRPARLASQSQGHTRQVQILHAAEAIGQVGADERADRRRFRDYPPRKFALSLKPDTQIVLVAIGVEWIQSIVDGIRLRDETS